MKEDIKHLQQMTHPNTYPTSPGNYRNFRTSDGLVICRRCNQVWHFARACSKNVPPPRAPTHYQNHQHNYVPPGPSQHPWPSYTPNRLSNQYSPRPSYRSHANRDTYVGAMEKFQESNRDNVSTNATPESVSQHALSECLAHSDLLSSQCQSMHTPLQQNSSVF